MSSAYKAQPPIRNCPQFHNKNKVEKEQSHGMTAIIQDKNTKYKITIDIREKNKPIHTLVQWKKEGEIKKQRKKGESIQNGENRKDNDVINVARVFPNIS